MEEQTPFGKPDYELPSYLEKVQSQLPALSLLMQLGWQYLTPEETVQLRGGRLGSTILEPILIDHIRWHCRYEFKGATHPFTENAIQNAVQALKGFRATGAMHQNEQTYDLLCLGTSVPQTIAVSYTHLTLPDKPKSRLQKYRVTEAGQALRKMLAQETLEKT